uniref:Uncharacterized protein n=1 Tax=Lactuca sativa TaxID=4236 RepID=A0A9R1XA85_LACSA|nr:hypothetical protein LSAT_V11C500294680 [Lactuca sativa]
MSSRPKFDIQLLRFELSRPDKEENHNGPAAIDWTRSKGKQEKTATHIGAGDGGAPYLSSSVNRSDTSSKPKLCHHQHRNQWGTLTALFVYLYSVQIIDFSQISLLPIFLYLLFLRGDSDSSDHESDFQNSSNMAFFLVDNYLKEGEGNSNIQKNSNLQGQNGQSPEKPQNPSYILMNQLEVLLLGIHVKVNDMSP